MRIGHDTVCSRIWLLFERARCTQYLSVKKCVHIECVAERSVCASSRHRHRPSSYARRCSVCSVHCMHTGYSIPCRMNFIKYVYRRRHAAHNYTCYVHLFINAFVSFARFSFFSICLFFSKKKKKKNCIFAKTTACAIFFPYFLTAEANASFVLHCTLAR